MVRLPDRWDVCAILGGGALAAGAWMISRPAGVILVGLELLVVGLTGAHSAKERGS